MTLWRGGGCDVIVPLALLGRSRHSRAQVLSVSLAREREHTHRALGLELCQHSLCTAPCRLIPQEESPDERVFDLGEERSRVEKLASGREGFTQSLLKVRVRARALNSPLAKRAHGEEPPAPEERLQLGTVSARLGAQSEINGFGLLVELHHEDSGTPLG